MEEVYLFEALRTPFGSFGGSLSDVPATDLATTVIEEIIKKYDLPNDAVDEVILGQVIQGAARQAPARQAMRNAGLSDKTHAMTINKVCGSGLKSVMLAAQSIMLGDSDLVLAGGMESMSMAPYALEKGRYGYRMGNGVIIDTMIVDALEDPYSGKHMGEITEESIKKNNITREEQDEYAIRSYTLSQRAIQKGIFKEEIAPVTKKSKKGDIVVDTDEEPGRGKIEKITSLKPVFKKDGTITAGNASTINDGAAVLLVGNKKAGEKYGLRPKAKIIAYSTNSIHPDDFGEAPIGAIEKILAKSGFNKNDIDLFEINEAFSAVPLMAIKRLGLEFDKINVNGGAVSLGHPVGASGGRLAATLLRELIARDKRYGIASLCIGGGESVAVLIERI
ncbi:MAG: thiolase family protein [Flexistipes sinusarabici]|uniref:Thiolase family protein n=1 Tax=Flexistipes sinusarabici TaxID=2352 RepID=A0A5D0MM33_FLESI|nr:thiolase family protein [Flexistipes sinusarabici]TYB34056.1 MAG: thiolase family protein [Flexistipes sinusarabici]